MRLAAACIGSLLFCFASSTIAHADRGGHTNTNAHGNVFSTTTRTEPAPTTPQPPGETQAVPPPPGTSVSPDVSSCYDFMNGMDGVVDACAALPPGATPPQVTAAMVLSAMRRTAPPQSVLQVQPPNGRTLVNFETNFFTVQPEFTRTMSMLGQQVQLQIWPSQFVWRFGDGESLQTASPGAKYPHLDVTHNYVSKGRYQPRVDTVYAAQFRVGGGAWQPVNGTVTVAGAAVPLQAVEARPKLVG